MEKRPGKILVFGADITAHALSNVFHKIEDGVLKHIDRKLSTNKAND